MNLDEKTEGMKMKKMLSENPDLNGVDIDNIYNMILCEAAKLKVDRNLCRRKIKFGFGC